MLTYPRNTSPNRIFILRVAVVFAVTMVAVAGLGVGVVAAEDHDDDDSGGRPIVNVEIDMDSVVDAIHDLLDELSDFTGSFSEILTEVLFQIIWQPFLDLLHATIQLVVGLLAWMPDTTVQEVLDIHKDVYLISLGLGTVGFTVIGLTYIGYAPFGLSYQRLHPLIPKLILALVFGGLAPWLLKYPVDLSEAVALALAPQNPDVTGMIVVSGELVLVAAVQSVAILALLVILGIVKLYVLFAAAAAPLIAVLWAIPFKYTQAKADTLIGLFWASLLIGPLDVIVLRLTLALLSLDGFDAATWLAGLSGTFLMLGLPYLLLSSGVAASAPAMATARGATQTVSRHVDPWNRSSTDLRQTSLEDYYDSAGGGHAAGPTPSQRQSNRFDKDLILDRGD